METLRPLKPPFEMALFTKGEIALLVFLGLFFLSVMGWILWRGLRKPKESFVGIPVDLSVRQWIEALLGRGEFLEAMLELDAWLLKVLSNRFQRDLRFLTSQERRKVLKEKKAWTPQLEVFFSYTDRLKFSEDRSVKKEDIRTFLHDLEPYLSFVSS